MLESLGSEGFKVIRKALDCLQLMRFKVAGKGSRVYAFNTSFSGFVGSYSRFHQCSLGIWSLGVRFWGFRYTKFALLSRSRRAQLLALDNYKLIQSETKKP